MQSASPKIIFLVPHIQPYLLAGIRKLVELYEAEIILVSWPAPEIAPVERFDAKNVKRFVKKTDNKDLIKQQLIAFDADIIFASGWMDNDYLKWCSLFRRNNKKVVMASDAQWRGTMRQYFNCLISPFFLKRVYTHVWVPGYFQYEYVRRLGFKKTNILTGLLTPDTAIFDSVYKQTKEIKRTAYPKQLLYIGRLLPIKFEGLLKAFTSLSDKERNGWQLVIAGDGVLKDSPLMQNKHIINKGFLQQGALLELMGKAGAFCLTSWSEAWGTAAQEAAAAGLPMVLSEQCGSHYSLLIPGYNGFLCDGNNVENIKVALRNILSLSPEQLWIMGERSNKIGVSGDSETWAATLMSLYR